MEHTIQFLLEMVRKGRGEDFLKELVEFVEDQDPYGFKDAFGGWSGDPEAYEAAEKEVIYCLGTGDMEQMLEDSLAG